jgi:hypothetical protein
MAKKRFFVGMLAMVFGFALTGCATNAGRYDPSSPPENDCTIILEGGSVATEVTKITNFDGTSVDWRSKYEGIAVSLQRVGDFVISIPSGTHTLTGWSGQPGLTAGAGTPQMSTTYDFIAGHTYKIKAAGSLQVTDVTK